MARAKTCLDCTSDLLQDRSNLFSMHIVCLLGPIDFPGYSQLSICSLHKHLSWDSTRHIFRTAQAHVYPMTAIPVALLPMYFLCQTLFSTALQHNLTYNPLVFVSRHSGRSSLQTFFRSISAISDPELIDAASGTSKGYLSPTQEQQQAEGGTPSLATTTSFPGTAL